MQDLLRATAQRAARYLASLQDRAVAPTPEALANLRRLDEPLPERPSDPTAVIALLDDIGSPATMASAGGLLRVRGRRVAAGGGGGEQPGRRVGSERGDRRPFAHCRAPGTRRHALAARRAGAATSVRRGV